MAGEYVAEVLLKGIATFLEHIESGFCCEWVAGGDDAVLGDDNGSALVWVCDRAVELSGQCGLGQVHLSEFLGHPDAPGNEYHQGSDGEFAC